MMRQAAADFEGVLSPRRRRRNSRRAATRRRAMGKWTTMGWNLPAKSHQF
jgi:hypothetical protein